MDKILKFFKIDDDQYYFLIEIPIDNLKICTCISEFKSLLPEPFNFIYYVDRDDDILRVYPGDFNSFRKIALNHEFSDNKVIILVSKYQINKKYFRNMSVFRNHVEYTDSSMSFNREIEHSLDQHNEDTNNEESIEPMSVSLMSKRSITSYAAMFKKELNYLPGSEICDGQTIVKKWRIKNVGGKKWKENSLKVILLSNDHSDWIKYELLNIPTCYGDQKIDIEMKVSFNGKWPEDSSITTQKLILKWLLYLNQIDNCDNNLFKDYTLTILPLTINIKRRINYPDESLYQSAAYQETHITKSQSESSIEKLDDDYSIVNETDNEPVSEEIKTNRLRQSSSTSSNSSYTVLSETKNQVKTEIEDNSNLLSEENEFYENSDDENIIVERQILPYNPEIENWSFDKNNEGDTDDDNDDNCNDTKVDTNENSNAEEKNEINNDTNKQKLEDDGWEIKLDKVSDDCDQQKEDENIRIKENENDVDEKENDSDINQNEKTLNEFENIKNEYVEDLETNNHADNKNTLNDVNDVNNDVDDDKIENVIELKTDETEEKVDHEIKDPSQIDNMIKLNLDSFNKESNHNEDKDNKNEDYVEKQKQIEDEEKELVEYFHPNDNESTVTKRTCYDHVDRVRQEIARSTSSNNMSQTKIDIIDRLRESGHLPSHDVPYIFPQGDLSERVRAQSSNNTSSSTARYPSLSSHLFQNDIVNRLKESGHLHENGIGRVVDAPNGECYITTVNLNKLKAMGFEDDKRLIRLLMKFDNNINDVINDLIDE